MKKSTENKIKGTVRDIKGKAKQAIGGRSGDSRMYKEGTDEKVGGKVQKKVGDIQKVFGK